MSKKKSISESGKDVNGFSSVLSHLCRQDDVISSPKVVTLSSDLHLKFDVIEVKDSRKGEKLPAIEESASAAEIHVAYEDPERNENPVQVLLKKMYVECALVRAVVRSTEMFSSITSLRIEDCCIGTGIVQSLALILSHHHGTSVADLSLDGNEGLQTSLPLLLRHPTGITYLSLRRCGLEDLGVGFIAQELSFCTSGQHQLKVLNLNMNRIGDLGARALATALRTNRSLMSLSLAGNNISDVGVSYLAEVLQRFLLTQEEILYRRRRIVNRRTQKKQLLEKLMQGWSEGERGGISKTELRSVEKIQRTRKPRNMSSRDLKRRSDSKLSKRDQMQNKSKMRGSGKNLTSSLTEESFVNMETVLLQVDRELSADGHPYINEVFPDKGFLLCHGCWTMADINLCYNNLTLKTVTVLRKLIENQNNELNYSQDGLFRVLIQPGNLISENSCEYLGMLKAMEARQTGREQVNATSASMKSAKFRICSAKF